MTMFHILGVLRSQLTGDLLVFVPIRVHALVIALVIELVLLPLLVLTLALVLPTVLLLALVLEYFGLWTFEHLAHYIRSANDLSSRLLTRSQRLSMSALMSTHTFICMFRCVCFIAIYYIIWDPAAAMRKAVVRRRGPWGAHRPTRTQD